MGATTFCERTRGKSMKEAYSKRVDELLEEYGHDTYNGTMSTTSGFVDKTEDFKRSGKTISQFIDDKIEDASKWGPAFGVCVKEPKSNSNKIKTQVINIPVKGTSKWELKYNVYNTWADTLVCSKSTKGDAIKAARDYTEKTKYKTAIVMEKALAKGSPKVAEIVYKKSKDEQDGEYVFFGWAAE